MHESQKKVRHRREKLSNWKCSMLTSERRIKRALLLHWRNSSLSLPVSWHHCQLVKVKWNGWLGRDVIVHMISSPYHLWFKKKYEMTINPNGLICLLTVYSPLFSTIIFFTHKKQNWLHVNNAFNNLPRSRRNNNN